MTFERFIVLIITDWLLNFKPFAREEVLGPILTSPATTPLSPGVVTTIRPGAGH